MTVPLLGLVDTLVLGHLDSPSYLGAVAVAGNIFGLVYISLNFLRTSTVGLSAQAYGQKNVAQQIKILFQALLISTVLGILLIVLSPLFIPVLLKFMMASDAVLLHATDYANIRILSAPAVLLTYVALGWLIGLQKTRGPLIILTLTNVVNIVLDIIFVSVFDFNVKGVAWATVIADYCGLLCATLLLLRLLTSLNYKFKTLKIAQLFTKEELSQLLSINGNLFIRTLVLLGIFAFFTAQGAKQGDAMLAANAILLNFLFLISNALDGFANAAETTTGEAWGLKNKRLFYRYCFAAFIWFLLITILLMLVFVLGGHSLIGLLTDIEAVTRTAITYLPWLVFIPLVSSWSYLFDGIFTGTTAIKAMRNTILLPGLLLYLPCWWAFQFMGNHGLWLAMAIFMLSRSILGWYYFRQFSTHRHWLSTDYQ